MGPMQGGHVGGRRPLHDHAPARQVEQQQLVVRTNGSTAGHDRDATSRFLCPVVPVPAQMIGQVQAGETTGVERHLLAPATDARGVQRP